jgi:hypothetical protein
MVIVFLSYSSSDKEIARRLTDELTRVGVRVWLDECEIKVGDNIIQNIEQGIRDSDYLALILTPRSVTSKWVIEELSAARMVQPGSKKILPLLFETCEVPPLLKNTQWADFRGSFESGLQELLNALGMGKQKEPLFESSNMKVGQRHRLKQRRDIIQEEWKLRSEKVKLLRKALATEPSVTIKFQLEQQLFEEETRLASLNNELGELDKSLQ